MLNKDISYDFFTADIHFDHKNIIKLSNRPFSNVQEMNFELIENWNNTVKENDDIFILGDFLFGENSERASQLLNMLNGRKYLIKGNHDKYLKKNFNEELFEWIKDYYDLRYKKRHFILFHYPILEWDKFFNESIHLYGHVHNMWQDEFKNIYNGKKALNVGVDVNNYCPISIEQVIHFFE